MGIYNPPVTLFSFPAPAQRLQRRDPGFAETLRAVPE
jgi:hypothetical protein